MIFGRKDTIHKMEYTSKTSLHAPASLPVNPKNRSFLEAAQISGTKTMNRRDLLRVAAGLAAGVVCWNRADAGDMPEITKPRATSGDMMVEPDWDERLSITVGPGKADIAGNTGTAIQAGVDYLARLGGGTLKLLPGEYRLRHAVRLQGNIRICGSGPETVLVKEPSIETKLAADSDWFDQEITLTDPSGFEIGDDVCIRATNVDTKAPVVIKRTLVARQGKRFKLDRALRANAWIIGEASVATLFPILTAEECAGFTIENLCLDGNKDNNANLDGNYAGCIWLQDCSNVDIRNVIARNYNGDGISWQICHDVLVENCHSHGHTGLGLHPGSGAQRTVIRNNRLEDNHIGLFFCWGVQYGLAENNTIVDNRLCGISIGHRDNENMIRNNEIRNSGQAGVIFRPERGEGFTATGNQLENNRIFDSGPEDGIAIDVQGVTRGNLIAGNELIETRAPAKRIGIRLGKDTSENTLTDNRIEGFAIPVQDETG